MKSFSEKMLFFSSINTGTPSTTGKRAPQTSLVHSMRSGAILRRLAHGGTSKRILNRWGQLPTGHGVDTTLSVARRCFRAGNRRRLEVGSPAVSEVLEAGTKTVRCVSLDDGSWTGALILTARLARRGPAAPYVSAVLGWWLARPDTAPGRAASGAAETMASLLAGGSPGDAQSELKLGTILQR